MPETDGKIGIENVENEIARLERELASKKEALRTKQESGEIDELPHDKEILKTVIKEKTEATESEGIPAPEAAPLIDSPTYLSEKLKNQVQQLINSAFAKSIFGAIKTVKTTNDSALIDAFHDALADELFDKLVERGKLKKL